MKQIKAPTRVEKRELVKSRLKAEPCLSSRKIAASLGVSPTFVSKIRSELQPKTVSYGQLAYHVEDWWKHPLFKENPTILDTITERSIRAARYPGVLDYAYEHSYKSITYAQTCMRREEKAKRKHPDVKITEQDVRLFVADVNKELTENDIKSGSVDLLCVDPLYTKSAIPTYKSISELAGRVLRDNGGVLLCVTGQSHLPEVLSALLTDKRLRYHWTIGLVVNRAVPSAPVQFKHIASLWKPIIMLTKGKYEGDLVKDLYTAPVDISDKDYHRFGQSEQVMMELIERFTDPYDVVLDCCIGGGSVITGAVKLNRRAIGCDIDPVAVKTTKRRVAELFGG